MGREQTAEFFRLGRIDMNPATCLLLKLKIFYRASDLRCNNWHLWWNKETLMIEDDLKISLERLRDLKQKIIILAAYSQYFDGGWFHWTGDLFCDVYFEGNIFSIPFNNIYYYSLEEHICNMHYLQTARLCSQWICT